MTDTTPHHPWISSDGSPPPSGPPSGGPVRPERSRPPVGLQNLLLGLGTALVAISVVVFTAVNWSQLDASVQGLILVALTAVAGAAATVAARRQMPSTSEALGTVAVLLGLADVHAFRVGLAPAADPWLFWAGGLGVVTLLAATLGRVSTIRAPQIAAGVLAQVPLLCILRSVETSVSFAQLAVVGQAFGVLVAADRLKGPQWARRAASAWALSLALLFTAATVLDSLIGEVFADADPHRGATGICLAAAAALALFAAWLRAESVGIRLAALCGATALGLGAVWFASMEQTSFGTSVGLVALAASLVLLLGRRVPKEWGEVPAVTAGVIGAGSVLPVAGAMASMLVAASTVSADAWMRSGSQVAADLQLAEATSYASTGLGLQLAAIVIAVRALGRRGSQVALATSAAVVALIGLVLSPLLLPFTITATVLIALAAVVVGVVAAVVVDARHPATAVAVGFAGMAYAWATPWSLATPGLTFATLTVGIVGAATVALVARRDGSVPTAVGAAVWVGAATPLFAGLVAWDAGVSVAMSWAIAATTAAVLSIVGVILLDPKGTAKGVSAAMCRAVEVTALTGYAGALLGVIAHAAPGAASVALAAGVLGFGLHAMRPGRLLAGLAAAIELLALIWLQLGQADVTTVEAYTLPLALVLLAVGAIGARLDRSGGGEPGSWITYGPALVVGLAPTVWLAFTETGSLRPLAGLVAGAFVLIGGVTWGKRALVDVGTVTVVALGLQQIAPVVGEIPNWATIGATGVVLIAVGATFEQRRRDLKAVLRKYSALT